MYSKRYDTTIREIIDLIVKMSHNERALRLKEAKNFKIKMRAVRKKCDLPILLHYGDGVYNATVTDLSFKGAFVECRLDYPNFAFCIHIGIKG